MLLLLPSVAVRDDVDDDFAWPLVRAVQPLGFAALADTWTGKRTVFTQGQSHRTAGRRCWSMDQTIERLYKRRNMSGDKADERASGKR